MQRSLRLKNELPTLNNQTGFSCWSVDDSLEHLQANLIGPPSSPYESGVFKLDIFIPARYPFEPPSVKFLTPIYHPNIDEAGRICHDVLKLPPKGAWKPSVNICAVLRNLQLLLIEPNPDDPLMADISIQYKHNRSQFDKQAREHTQQHAVTDLQSSKGSP